MRTRQRVVLREVLKTCTFINERGRLTNAVYAQTRAGAFAKDYGLSDQIRRAAVSIMSNVAEGFERGTSTEFVQFLYVDKGSCGEVRAQLQIAVDQAYITTQAHVSLADLARRISGVISNFIAHLQGSDYRGEKFHRPQRQARAQSAKWQAIGQATQLANIRAQAQYQRQHQQIPPASPSHPSHPSHPSPL